MITVLKQDRILNYCDRYCQRTNAFLEMIIQKNWLRPLFCLFLSASLLSCSSDPKPEAIKVKSKPVLAEAVWFNVPERFTMRDEIYNVETHPFFDLVPFKTKDGVDINFYLTTPVGSQHHYDLDIKSGKVYRVRTYCPQKDIWEKYDKTTEKAPFSMGVIPRLLDQSGVPQKIWLFGKKDFLHPSKEGGIDQSQRARVVGGVVHQYCDNYPCQTNKDWLSRLILVGVLDEDPMFKEVRTLEELKTKVKWDEIKAFAENNFGRKVSGQNPEPAYRLVGEVKAKAALDFAFKKGHFFSFQEINSMRKNCLSLYDYLWRSQKRVRENLTIAKRKQEEIAGKSEEERRKLIELKEYGLGNVINDEIEVKIRVSEQSKEGQKALNNWGTFFVYFHENYGERYHTCSKFVRPANFKHDSERAWFFSLMTNWFNLESLGQHFFCSGQGWLENPRMTDGSRRFKELQQRFCGGKTIDLSFDQAITNMSALETANQPHYRFIQYDYGLGGTHEELYSWVFHNGKEIQCEAGAPGGEARSPFPNDVTWKGFYEVEDRNFYDIIR